MTVRVTVPASFDIVALADAKAWCNVDGTDSDDLIGALIASAAAKVETYTGLAIGRQTRVLTAPGFPVSCWASRARTNEGLRTDRLKLPGGDIAAVTSAQYLDTAGATQTLVANTDYVLSAYDRPAYIVPVAGASWPATLDHPAAVTVTYTCGWIDAASIPAPIVEAMKRLIAHGYANREAIAIGPNVGVLPLGVDWLLADYRQWGFGA